MAATNTEVWQRGAVLATDLIAENIRRIVLASPNPAKADPGSHVDVSVLVNGVPEVRSYSVVDSSADSSQLAISVLAVPASRGGSRYLHGLRAGDPIDFTQPLQNFPLRLGAPEYILLAGGIGITAVANMATLLARVKADYRLVYVGRRRVVMAYLEELAERHGDRLSVQVHDEGTPLLVDALVRSTGPATELYMCGPIRLMDAVRRAWVGAGRDLPNLRFETFGNSGWFEAQPFALSIPRLRLEIVVGREQSMLEALEDAGVDVMSDCRKGECGLCEVRILDVDGVVDHRDVFYSEQQRQEQRKLCCCVSRVAAAETRSKPVPVEHVSIPRLTIDVA